MDLTDEIKELRRLLADEKSQREEEQRRREEEQRRREEEQRRREEAEELAKESQPQTLSQYLEACHSLSLAIQVVTDRSLTTQGETTNPTGRLYPQRITPWQDFAARQERIWERLSNGRLFHSQPSFPTTNQLAYVTSLLSPISSEAGLRDFERDTVENAVRKLFTEAYHDPQLRSDFGLQGNISFESHTNLGRDTLSEPMERISISDRSTGAQPAAPARPRRRARGKGNRADQFCISRNEDGQNVPAVAIEYKPPHKLTQEEVVVGLGSEIRPQRDVIHQTGEGFEFAARSLAAAVVTQLFSYMIGKGVQYGYVCTGEVFIFLFIPEDPTAVHYHVAVPNLDVIDDDTTRLHRTAVAQVFAFILQAVCAEPPPASWHDATADLGTWAVEYDDVLREIPTTIRKERPMSAYKPQRWKGFERSPIRTRSRCKRPQDALPHRSDDEDEERTPSPTPNQRSGPARSTATAGTQKPRAKQDGGNQEKRPVEKQKIRERPFCTPKCLLGVSLGGPMDSACPNAKDHKRGHVDRSEFLRLIRDQLAKDRGSDADCAPLYLAGALGALFKVRLSSHGYTLVAKGMEKPDLPRLCHEEKVYSKIRPMQGRGVPVCLGIVELVLPYYYDCGVFTHFMFLSWGGRPLFEYAECVKRPAALDAITDIYTRLHHLGVLHRDAEARNILYASEHQSFTLVDFERAVIPTCKPLASISPNRQAPKRKRGAKGRVSDPFTQELQLVCGNVLKCIR
ncbi:Reticulocyte-binding protein 2-like protein a [Apiospora arundinis]|uniref:Reticulocyte-binding protein 2-like protein a n=1 Tax=Apiospora arundinis TaxID=335852 RepID=A0ABR2HRQ4_9PEZI